MAMNLSGSVQRQKDPYQHNQNFLSEAKDGESKVVFSRYESSCKESDRLNHMLRSFWGWVKNLFTSGAYKKKIQAQLEPHKKIIDWYEGKVTSKGVKGFSQHCRLEAKLAAIAIETVGSVDSKDSLNVLQESFREFQAQVDVQQGRLADSKSPSLQEFLVNYQNQINKIEKQINKGFGKRNMNDDTINAILSTMNDDLMEQMCQVKSEDQDIVMALDMAQRQFSVDKSQALGSLTKTKDGHILEPK